MEPVFFVMAILGCGDGNTDCREARLDTVRYATAAQCQAALPAGLARNTDLDYPSIAAACRANGPMVVKVDKPQRKG